MKCVEVITLRSLAKASIESLEELLRQVFQSKRPKKTFGYSPRHLQWYLDGWSKAKDEGVLKGTFRFPVLLHLLKDIIRRRVLCLR